VTNNPERRPFLWIIRSSATYESLLQALSQRLEVDPEVLAFGQENPGDGESASDVISALRFAP